MKKGVCGRVALTALCFCLMFSVYAGNQYKDVYGSGKSKIVLATGSPGELGLLDALAKAFNKKYDTKVCWIKAGTGASLKLLKERKADLIMVHAPDAEKKAVKEGWAAKRTLIGSNEFYIVGPKDDPAGISNAKSAADAYTKIAEKKAPFISRNDNSGTNKKELAIWKKTGIKPKGQWYITTNDFMMASLKKANDVKGYFMTDSSTWVAGKKSLPNLKILYRGDPVLVNTYHALCLPGKSGKNQYAAKFIDFLASDEAQSIIKNYGKSTYGEAMYNDADYAKKYVH